MFETVLVAVDGSDESVLAAQTAIDLTAPDGTVHALAVVEEIPMYTRPGRAERATEDASAARTRATEAVEAVGDLAGDRRVETTVESGLPRRVIVSHADSIGADAIVVGKRGASDTAADLLGSTAEHVVRTASVPVVTVPMG